MLDSSEYRHKSGGKVMARVMQKVERTTIQDGEPLDNGAATTENTVGKSNSQVIATRIVWYLAGVLLVLLAFRFVLALLGANPYNGFANFIYTVSHPFVAPFFSLFGYNLRYGVSRFETFTLVAMAVYTVVAYGITYLINIA